MTSQPLNIREALRVMRRSKTMLNGNHAAVSR